MPTDIADHRSLSLCRSARRGARRVRAVRHRDRPRHRPDNTGAVVPGATVTLTSLDTGIATTKVTDENGSFEFVTVRIGRYKVTAELAGLLDRARRQRAGHGRRPAARRPAADARQRHGNGRGRRRGDAGSRPTRASAARSSPASRSSQLPLNGREYSALALLSPGVRLSALNTGSASTVREGSFNINGLRSTFNNFLLDGIDNNAYGTSNQGFSNQVMQPSPDAVAEFKVVTNNMSAEYGRSAGGTINVAYRSGTNRFSGAAWEFFRDTKLNATGFFKPVTGEKPPLEPRSVRRHARRADRAEPRVLLRRLRGVPPDAQERRVPDDPERRRSARASCRVDGAQPADRRRSIPPGTPIPMTDFARKVLCGAARPDVGRRRRTTTRSSRSSPTTPTSATSRGTSRSARR